MPHQGPLLLRFLAKFVVDILPAALASVIGGFLFSQYQAGHPPVPPPVVEQVTPASAEMMQLVRDEHAVIVDYLKSEIAAQKNRLAAEDAETARAAADAKAETGAAVAAARRVAVAANAPKASAVRTKSPAAAGAVPAHAPLVIAQAEPVDAASNSEPSARDSNTLLAKTLDIKDHVVDATLQVVSAIGSIPSWLAGMGDRIGGQNSNAQPLVGRLASTPS